jgi:hypothetical protein
VFEADVDWSRLGQVTGGIIKASVGFLSIIFTGWAFVITDSPLSVLGLDLSINMTVSGWNDVMPDKYDISEALIPSFSNYYK